MKKIIIKSAVAATVICAAVIACSQNIFNGEVTDKYLTKILEMDKSAFMPSFLVKQNSDSSFSFYGKDSVYGAYLAARVAHMRQDFSNAAEYYKIVLEKDADNKKVNHYVYAILSSLGHINEAAPYAQKEIDNGAEKTIAPLVLALQNFAEGNYEKAREQMDSLHDEVYTTIVAPLFDAWTYAGEKNEQGAMDSLNKLMQDPQLLSTKIFHAAMIYDYLGNPRAADELYSEIILHHPNDVTYRFLEVISDFYVRNGNKPVARQITQRYRDNSLLAVLLNDINKRIDNGRTGDKAIIDTPQKGLAEAMFNIGNIFFCISGGAQLAQIYIAAASFLNPDYEVSKIALANILEELGLLKEANRYYKEIKGDSGSYFIARLKMIENLNTLKEYDEAKKVLKSLLKDYPDNPQLLEDLGNIAASMGKDKEAVEVYQKALKVLPQNDENSWPVYYAIAVSYDKIGEKNNAEKYLLTALKLSNRNPSVLNYLGYSWLTQAKNTDDAIRMIIEAYKQAPYEGHIIDSLGWVYFKLGMYEKAVEYLEQASDMNPGNAVISDHLGDAYWFIGRKNEAVFQWKQALALKEDSESLNKGMVRQKIDSGIAENNIFPLKDETLLESLQNLNKPQD